MVALLSSAKHFESLVQFTLQLGRCFVDRQIVLGKIFADSLQGCRVHRRDSVFRDEGLRERRRFKFHEKESVSRGVWAGAKNRRHVLGQLEGRWLGGPEIYFRARASEDRRHCERHDRKSLV